MKAFEKWLEKQKPYDPFCCAGMGEKAWKAALEWALSKKETNYLGDFEEYFIDANIIEGELEQ